MVVKFECSIHGQYMEKDLEFNPITPEYIIADAAFDLAIKFANSQINKLFGHRLSSSEYEDYLSDLDYSYSYM